MTVPIYIAILLATFLIGVVANETWENVTGDGLCKPKHKPDMYCLLLIVAIFWYPLLMVAIGFAFFAALWGIGKLISNGLAKLIKKHLDKRKSVS